MDQSLPQGSRKGNDHRTSTRNLQPSHFVINFLVTIGLDHRLRKAEKRTSTLQPRLGPDYDQGYEACRRDQEEEGARILEEQVRPCRFFFYRTCFDHDWIYPQKDGRSQGEGQGPPTESPREQRVRLDKIGRTGRCLYLANTGENQDQVLSSQCTYPWRRPIDGYGGRLTIFSVSYALLYIGVTHPGDLIHTHWVVHKTVLDCEGELVLKGVTIRTGYRCLYLASVSCLEFGSNVLCSPSSVLLTASLAPIIGLRTAIGTARTTARTGPWKSTSYLVDSDNDRKKNPPRCLIRTLPSGQLG